jgi:hypothetical protein
MVCAHLLVLLCLLAAGKRLPLPAVPLTTCRFSVVDPWMHEKNDGFPLLYVRSHAARLPGSVVRDWLVRCKVALAASQGRLVLKVRCMPTFVCYAGALYCMLVSCPVA